MNNCAIELREAGYTCIKTTSANDALSVARNLGEIATISGIAPAQTLIPHVSDSQPTSSYSGIYGINSFPLHTDMAHWHIPPRYLLLYCVQPAEAVPTLIIHSNILFGAEDETILRRAIFRPRRRIEGRLTSLRLREQGRCRWDPLFIQPLNKIAMLLKERISRRIELSSPHQITWRNQGECVVLDNWHVLHGRAEVPSSCAHRKLERVYLNEVRL